MYFINILNIFLVNMSLNHFLYCMTMVLLLCVMYDGVLAGIEPPPLHNVLPRHSPGRFSEPYHRAV